MIYILFVILISVVTFFIFWLINVIFLSPDAPFVEISKRFLPDICDALELHPGMMVYELGCGDGRLLAYAASQHPKTKFIGIDSNFVAFFLAKYNTRKLNNVEILRGNFFNRNFSTADRIYTYLFPKVMPKLISKLEQELKPGSKLVSCSFYAINRRPESILSLAGKHEKLYIYRF